MSAPDTARPAPTKRAEEWLAAHSLRIIDRRPDGVNVSAADLLPVDHVADLIDRAERAEAAARALAQMVKRYVAGWNNLEVPGDDMDELLIEMDAAADKLLAAPAAGEEREP